MGTRQNVTRKCVKAAASSPLHVITDLDVLEVRIKLRVAIHECVDIISRGGLTNNSSMVHAGECR